MRMRRRRRATTCGVIKIVLQPRWLSISFLNSYHLFLVEELAFYFVVLHTLENRLNMHLLLNFSNSWQGCHHTGTGRKYEGNIFYFNYYKILI